MSQVPAWRRSFDRWSPEETAVLVSAWAPLYRSRRSGAKDAWVPLHIRGRARSSRALVTEDWRAVAIAVNSYRAVTPRLDSCRTHLQCKKRIAHLKSQYVKGVAPRLGWPFFDVLHAVWAQEVGGGGAAPVAAGDAASTVAATDGAAVEAPAGAVVVEGAAAAAAAEDDAGGTASAVARGGAFVVHENYRAAAAAAVNSCRTADGTSSERAHKQCRGRVKPLTHIYEKKHDVVSGAAAVDEERGGASIVDGSGAAAEAVRRRATFVPPPIPKRPRSAKPAASASANVAVGDGDLSAQALAAGSVDAAVLTKLAEIYKELRMKALDVEREKTAAAAHAGAGGRA